MSANRLCLPAWFKTWGWRASSGESPWGGVAHLQFAQHYSLPDRGLRKRPTGPTANDVEKGRRLQIDN